jgi:hypothetical protein
VQEVPVLADPVDRALEPVLAPPEPVVLVRVQRLSRAVPLLVQVPQGLELPDPAHFLVVLPVQQVPAHFLVVLLVPQVPAQVPPELAVQAQVLVVLAQVALEPEVLLLLLSRRSFSAAMARN